jgi:hypothetical protein
MILSKRFSRKAIRYNASVRMSDSEIIAESAKQFVQKIDPNKLEYRQVLELFEDKLEYYRSLYYKLIILSGVPTLLLFLSISGVQFEISLLGIKLNYIQRVKEAVVAFSMVGNLVAIIVEMESLQLRAIRFELLKKIYGENDASVLQNAKDRFPDWNFPRTAKGYAAWGWSLTFDSLLLVSGISVLAVAAAAVVYIEIVVIFDIWLNSNLGKTVGRSFALVVGGISFTLFFAVQLRKLFKFRYTDIEKLKNQPIVDEATGELTSQMKMTIDLLLSRRKKYRDFISGIFWIATFILAAAIWINNYLANSSTP